MKEDRSGMERQGEGLARWLQEHPDNRLDAALADAGVSAGPRQAPQPGALRRFIEGGRNGVLPPGMGRLIPQIQSCNGQCLQEAG